MTRRQILDCSKLKKSADDNFRFDENIRKFSKRVEKYWEKGEIARYEQFLLFQQCFKKACFPVASKGVVVWEWVINHKINQAIYQCLTHYHTMAHFDALNIYSCRKLCEKRRNYLQQAISPFSQCFLPYMAVFSHFKCTLKCCQQFVSIWTSLKFCRLVMIKKFDRLTLSSICTRFNTLKKKASGKYCRKR